MSKNMTRKGLAFGAGLALVSSALVALPAAALPGDISLAPDVGTNYAVFNHDTFALDIDVSTLAPTAVTTAKALRIENPDQNTLAFSMPGATLAEDTIKVKGYDSLGNNDYTATLTLAVDANTDADIADATDVAGAFIVDFAAEGIVSLVIYDIEFAAASTEVDISVLHDVATSNQTDVLTNAEYAARDVREYGQGSASITVQAYAEADGNFRTVDAGNESDVETITFYDASKVAMIPRIERFETTAGPTENDAAEDVLGATLAFGVELNLAMIDLGFFTYEVVVRDPDASRDATVTEYYYGRSAVSSLDAFDVLPSFAAGGDRDDADRIYLEFAGNEATLDHTHATISGVKTATVDGAGDETESVDFEVNAGDSFTFTVNMEKNDDSTTRDISSASFALPANTSDALGIEATVTTTGASSQADEADVAFDLVAGTKAITYTAQLSDDAAAGAGEAEAEASTPVLVSVKAVTYLSKDGGYTVSGTPSKIEELNQTVFVTGFTDSKGQFSVTVTSDAALKAESYVVTFHFLSGSTWTDATAYTATYNTSAPADFSTPITVLGGESAAVTFAVEDQFGAATDVSGTKALSVILQASDTDNLEEIVAVKDGSASFSFDNYLAAGESDIITATLVTGTLTDNVTVLTPITLTLYNTETVAAINVPDTYKGAITHADFVDGKVSATNPAPGTATARVTATLVDSNGSGVPGAVATLAADNMNFKQVGATTYFLNAITVVADAAGVINVDVWTHTVTGATGADLTITSGGKTETVEIESYFPQAMPGNVLDFKFVNLPAKLLANTTYAVKVSLQDKWGNPVATNSGGNDGAVEIVGNGSVLVNNVEAGVSKNFGKDGTTTVFLRSVKDISGPGSVSATLQGDADYSAWNGTAVITTETFLVAETATDVLTTVWDETKFANELEVDIEVVDVLPAASADAKVNAGSFNGYVAVYAKGYKGQTLSWKIAGQWFKTTITEDYQVFQRTTAAVGVDVTVELYINGQRPAALVKQVLTR
jgi:hypothetical protein